MTSMQTTGDKVVYPWEFELSGEIQEFHIWYSRCIDAIMFVYKDNNNKIINSPRFGSKDGGSLYVMKFAPEEYILGVRGSLGFVDGIAVVGGFQFLTTPGWGKAVSTPGAVGTYDLSLASGDKRLRFYGNYGTKYLHSFGFAAAPVTKSDNGFGEQSVVPAVPRYITKKDGPFGGPGGANSWEFKFASHIREIDIRCGTCVDSITFHFRNNENQDCSSKRFGGSGGGLIKVRFADNEKIIGISGTFGVFAGHTVITSISFTTPLRTHGPFGTIKGTTFSTHIPQAMITEFYGNYGLYLDSIGVVFLVNPDANINNGYVRELVEAQVKKNPAYVIAKDGPFGGDGANSWEFTFPDKVREIHIWSDKYINSIMFVYKDNDNKDVNSQRFGGDGGNLKKVTLRDDDFLTGFGGSYGDFEGNIVIMSIRFQTTQLRKQFGSINQGYKFDVVRTGPLKLNKFHGKYGTYLHSIGAVYDVNVDGCKEVVPEETIPTLPTTKDGPFGGPGGVNPWEFKFVGEIREIHIWSANCVHSIMFVYKDNDNKDRSSQRYGDDGGNLQKVIKLAHNESVIGISGTSGEIYGETVITSISFETPYSIYGPFGKIQGDSFLTSRPQAKVTEFFGRHGQFLDSIGAVFLLNDNGDGGNQVVPIPRLPTIKDEPFGGPGGVFPWEFKFVGEIREIHIWSLYCIDSIMFVYKDHDNKDRSSKRYGGTGGNLEKVILPHNDRVIAISGTSGFFHGNMVIMSISFRTRHMTHGPYGAKGIGTKFLITRPEVKIAEFYGRYGQYLHSIGAAYYIKDTQRNGVGGEPGENIPRLPTAKDGPFGGTNGVIPWEFKFVEEIREIHIQSGSCIDSLMFVYRDNDHKDSNSRIFGSEKKRANVQKVTLAQNEHIIGISGTFGLFYGNTVITSISFETSKQTYGPYGKTQGTSFATSRRRAKLTEFYGRHGPYLDSIGAVFLMNDKNSATGQDAKEEGPSKGEINRDGQLWDLKFVGEIREIYVRSGSCLDSMKFDTNGNKNGNLRKVTE